MTRVPTVTVVMPSFNAQNYIADAVRSILRQSFTDFELLVVNDGSTDATAETVSRFTDDRIRMVNLPLNVGLAEARNVGLEYVRSRYVAWLDSDDISHPDRLRHQVGFLDANPRIGMCGTWTQTFGMGKKSTWRYPRKTDFLRASMIFDDPFATSSVMMRADVIEHLGSFRPDLSPAEDYDYWSRLMETWDAVNLARTLTQYRIHQSQSSTLAKDEQRIAILRIQRRLLQELGISPTADEWKLHLALGVGWGRGIQQDHIACVRLWLDHLRQANLHTNRYELKAFSAVLSQRERLAKESAQPRWWRRVGAGVRSLTH